MFDNIWFNLAGIIGIVILIVEYVSIILDRLLINSKPEMIISKIQSWCFKQGYLGFNGQFRTAFLKTKLSLIALIIVLVIVGISIMGLS